MTNIRIKLAAAAIAIAATGAFAAPAYAGTGCNGVVNIFVWGCAPWDNNNGPKFPYYKKRTTAMQAPKGSKITLKDGHAMVNINGREFPVVGGANGVIAAGGGNIISGGAGNVVASGGLNLQVWVEN
ncbi:hypothetical protein [Sphingomonas sp.]|uniref:hypothetical protein n=1 Tax=Sphingomonas sp. TaxID=28214 RepID=UPI002ED9D53C